MNKFHAKIDKETMSDLAYIRKLTGIGHTTDLLKLCASIAAKSLHAWATEEVKSITPPHSVEQEKESEND